MKGDFGWALEQMQAGGKVRRRHWPTGEHVRLRPDGKEIVDEDGAVTRFRDSEPLLARDWVLA